MSAVFNIQNTLGTASWRPVDFNVVGDNFKVKNTHVLCSNGMSFKLHNFLKNAMDFSINKKTGMFLTNFIYNSYFLENKEVPNIEVKLTKIESPILSRTNTVIKQYKTDLNDNNSPFYLKDSKSKDYSNNDIFSFIFNSDDTLSIQNNEGDFLTLNGIGTSATVLFKTEVHPRSDTQIFDYILGVSSIAIFEYNSYYSRILYVNGTNYSLIVNPITVPNNVPISYFFNFVSYKQFEIEKEKSTSDSFLVSYSVNPTQIPNPLDINEEFSTSNLYSQNYLGMFPIENIKKTQDEAFYDLQIHGLKNYQTSEYTYSTANPILTACPSIKRIYNKIYTGTNQAKGYDRVFLGYQSNTKEFTFNEDSENIFYYPPTSKRISLQSSGLIEDGAIAGEIPFTSDRLYMYRGDYEEIIKGISQPKSIKKFDNTWLCSWLSGTNTGDKIWMDRYYNAAYYTLDQALTAKALVYNERIYPTNEYTFDIPSETYFEPGVLYSYERGGIDNSRIFLNFLDKNSTIDEGANVLSITEWLSSPLLDNSDFKNNGLVYFADPDTFIGNYWKLKGNNHALFLANDSLLQKQRLTVSMWLNVDDWSNINGEQIFGNYFESGFGLINSNGNGIPVLTITNSISATAYTLNYKFKKLNEVPLLIPNTLYGYDTEYSYIFRLPDFTYWVFDVLNKTASKFNQVNSLILQVTNINYFIENINQIEIDSQKRFYLYDDIKKIYCVFDSNMQYLLSVDVPFSTKRIEISLNDDEVIFSTGYTSVIDNNNVLWEVIGGSLYKNRVFYATVGFTQQISVDFNNNLWISHEQDRISRINSVTDTVDFSFRIGRRVSNPLDPCDDNLVFRYIDFVRTPLISRDVCNRKEQFEDVLILVDTRDNEVYAIDSLGNMEYRSDLRTLNVENLDQLKFNAKGDFTGYQFVRKFIPRKTTLSWKFKIAQPDGRDSQLLSLSFSTSSLPRGWHHFSFVFDSFRGVADFYIDTINVSTISFEPNLYELYYDYRSSLLLGAASIKNTTLNDLIGLDDVNKFIGNISDLKMYSKSLSVGEIEAIYFSSELADPRKYLKWNLDVGDRNFIEEIEYWYKNQLPGSKSNYFNINIHNLDINDDLKYIIETTIKDCIDKIKPAETSLYKINWI